jgi:hypothetical protein
MRQINWMLAATGMRTSHQNHEFEPWQTRA